MTGARSFGLPPWRAWVAIVAAALLLACGGGVGTGGTGDAPAVTAEGPITGFGSIFVAGVEFDDSEAVVLDDAGTPVARTGSELRLGMTVSVEGSAASGQTPRARTIRIASAVVGAATAIDAAAGSLTVHGLQVRVDGSTVVDPSLAGGLASLEPGDTVAVYGLAEPAAGRYVATRIERTSSAVQRASGVVGELDRKAGTFRIGPTRFAYAGAANVPDDLENGSTVSLRLHPGAGSGTIAVAAFESAAPPRAEGARAEVEGGVVAVGSDGTFTVDGTTVDASAAAVEPAGVPLAAGARVEVRGQTIGGVLVADRVKVYSDEEIDRRPYKLNGSISALDTVARTFVVRDTTVGYANAEFKDGSPAQLAVGAKVRAEGPLSSDGTRVEATRVEFK